MHENDAKLNRCKKLLATPPKVDRNKTAPKCLCCPYFQPEFRYRKCLYASCPYGKDRNTAFRKKPLRSERIVTARIDVTDLVHHSKETGTKFYINFLFILSKVLNSREDYRMGYLRETDELICYDVINPIQYIFHEDTETSTLVYTEHDEDYEKFYAAALRDAEEAKKTREYGFDIMNHPNWFDASSIPWLSYDAMHLELPDVHMFFAPVINWGKYREENGRLVMPVTVRLNHAIADGYLAANVFRLLEQEINSFIGN